MVLDTIRPLSSSNRDVKHKKKESIAFLSRSPQETLLGPPTLAPRVAVARYQSMNNPLLACPLFFPPEGREHFHLIIDGSSTSPVSPYPPPMTLFRNTIFFCVFTCALFFFLVLCFLCFAQSFPSRAFLPVSSFVIHIFLFLGYLCVQ